MKRIKKQILLQLLFMMLLTLGVQAQQFFVTVPLGGNSWVTSKAGNERVTNKGWMNWEQADAVFSTYVYVQKKGIMQIAAMIELPSGVSTIKCTVANQSTTTKLEAGKNEYRLGKFEIPDTGYVRIDMQGISKTGNEFARIEALQLSGSVINDQTAFVKNNEGNYFYWGRRGPSVHINYDLTGADDDVEYFYNEITVPEGNDIIGSYFMANGFAEGYFGMQVNSASERRILFSVWSPYHTDDPKEIPDSQKIVMLRKGKDVYTGEFGNEGSGGQSYLKYNWKAGETCKFLLRGKPVENNYTNYTAWFYSNAEKKWLLIASFNRPGTATYLKRLHSFLENFDPNTGYISRKAYYQNQWIRTKAGVWKPISKMFLTADATAMKGFRNDYDGGVENGKFYMRNCGFFNERAMLLQTFTIKPADKVPVSDMDLPMLF